MASNFHVTVENGAYRVEFPYDPSAVQALKTYVSPAGRSWDNLRKCWMIASSERRNAEKALGMTFPDIGSQKPVEETRLLEVRYIGQCKERAPGDLSAFGMDKSGNWAFVFPQDTLLEWFEGVPYLNDTPNTLYAVLGAKQSFTQDEIKTAYRRMAKQWHPDVCREPDAHKMFLRIREAWDILGNERMRAKYDAGLALEASINLNIAKGSSLRLDYNNSGYRSPLRCGYILATGFQQLARFQVTNIISWDDITNKAGQVLVVSWKMGDQKPTEVWA